MLFLFNRTFQVDYIIPWKFDCKVCGTFFHLLHIYIMILHASKLSYLRHIFCNTILSLVLGEFLLSVTDNILGEDCVLSFPVIKQSTTIPGPDCPFANATSSVSFDVPLGKTSPVDGIPTHFSGHITVKKADIAVARISVEAAVV